MTITQRKIYVDLSTKRRSFHHNKPYPLEIKSLGDLLMVRRRNAGFSYKEMSAKLGVKVHWLRRWEFGLSTPTHDEWVKLGNFLDLPANYSALTFTQFQHGVEGSKTMGEHLSQRRTRLKLCRAEAARFLGISSPTLEQWELDGVFPSIRHHPKIVSFLGYNPFPNDARENANNGPALPT